MNGGIVANELKIWQWKKNNLQPLNDQIKVF